MYWELKPKLAFNFIAPAKRLLYINVQNALRDQQVKKHSFYVNWILAPQLPFISYKHEYVLELIEIERLKMDNINYWANGGHQVWLLKKDIYNLERRTASQHLVIGHWNNIVST